MVDACGASKTDELRRLVAEHFKADTLALKPETRFIEDLSADDVDLSELRLHVEDQLNIDLPHLDAIQTYGELEDIVTKASA
ncbi:MAG: acyl carrier protein [Pseudomonas fluorescens]|nr:MAG: acyl carrier protein [Pseudomonas fluorescens]